MTEWTPIPTGDPADDLPIAEREYRRLGADRAMDVAGAAGPARDALLAAHAEHLLDPFPSVDPMRERESVAGRVVVLPPAPPDAFVFDSGDRNAVVCGDGERGWYFTRTDQGGMARVMRAVARYEAKVGVDLSDQSYEIIGRLTGDPRMVVVGDAAEIGLEVDAIGVMIGDYVFVDATRVTDGESPFAGEHDLVEIPPRREPDGSDPASVLAAWIAAAKVGDEETWRALTADWYIKPHPSGMLMWYPSADRAVLTAGWNQWRQWLLERTYGVRPVRASTPELVDMGMDFEGAPRIESARLAIEHLDVDGGTVRAVTPPDLPGEIELQRDHGGPWRVVY